MTFEFSLAGYQHLLSHLADSRYTAVTFKELPQAAAAGSCVLRHDVDGSLVMACTLAELEAERGVRSTYFVMLRSPLYNVLSRQGQADLRRLTSFGHDIGLHFDSRDGDPGEPIEERIVRDATAFSELAGVAVTAFSFHQPTAELVAGRVTARGLVNAYTLDELGYHYAADSNRNWRGQNVAELIRQRRALQLLLHPMWWVCDAPHVHDCWDAALQHNFDRQQQHLMATEDAYGPERRQSLSRPGGRT